MYRVADWTVHPVSVSIPSESRSGRKSAGRRTPKWLSYLLYRHNWQWSRHWKRSERPSRRLQNVLIIKQGNKLNWQYARVRHQIGSGDRKNANGSWRDSSWRDQAHLSSGVGLRCPCLGCSEGVRVFDKVDNVISYCGGDSMAAAREELRSSVDLQQAGGLWWVSELPRLLQWVGTWMGFRIVWVWVLNSVGFPNAHRHLSLACDRAATYKLVFYASTVKGESL